MVIFIIDSPKVSIKIIYSSDIQNMIFNFIQKYTRLILCDLSNN